MALASIVIGVLGLAVALGGGWFDPWISVLMLLASQATLGGTAILWSRSWNETD